MQPIALNVPKAFQYIRSRLGIRTGIGRNAELSMIVVPVVQIDPLLLVSRSHHKTIDVAAAAGFSGFTCPPGEFWHLKKLASIAAGDYSYVLLIYAPSYEDPLTINGTVVQSLVLDDAGTVVTDLSGIVMRPGDAIEATSSAYVTQGDLSLDLLFDLEDCSS